MIKKSLLIVLISCSLMIFSASEILAGSATVSWSVNTEPDLSGYKVYYGTSPRTGTDPKVCSLCGYTSSLNVGNVTTHTFNSLTDGQTYYFSVSAYDTSNNESSFSSEVSKVIPAADTTPPAISAVVAALPGALPSLGQLMSHQILK